jgi:hypothetical protein
MPHRRWHLRLSEGHDRRWPEQLRHLVQAPNARHPRRRRVTLRRHDRLTVDLESDEILSPGTGVTEEQWAVHKQDLVFES